ncbi:MAG: PorV/PorQ family protein [Bacteroidota bacterium]
MSDLHTHVCACKNPPCTRPPSLQRIVRRFLLGAVFPILVPAAVFAQPGQSGLSFLKLGVGGRAIGMGEAHAALSADASALHYNPAALSLLEKANLTLMHKEWVQDIRTEFLAASVPFNQITLGFHLNSTRISDIEVRTRPGPPEAIFNAQNFVTGISAAYELDRHFIVGITAKFLYEKIFVDEASGFGFDLGAVYTPAERDGSLRFGAALTNLGSMGKLRTESSELPTAFRVGSAYTIPLEALESKISLAADGFSVFEEGDVRINTGGELDYKQTVALRIGYLWNSEGRGLTLGFGAQYTFVRFDYAFSSLAFDLGDAHILSLSIDL